MSLLDPKRLVASSYQSFRSQLSHGSLVTANPETVDGMLESLGRWLLLWQTVHFIFILKIHSSWVNSIRICSGILKDLLLSCICYKYICKNFVLFICLSWICLYY